MSQTSIGVAIVGTGFGQKVHIPGFKAHHRTEVVAVYHRDLNQAQAIAKRHAIPHACDTIEAIVSLSQVQAVSVSTPPFAHHSMAAAVLKAGKHLLLEKPTALNVQEAKELHKLAQQQKVAAVMDFEFRFIPAWQRLAELLKENYLGQKRLIKIDWIAGSRANPKRAWNWYARKDQGGGALGSIGSHMFDYVDWLFGPIKRLSANLSTTIAQRPDPVSGEYKSVDSDDTCSITLELVDGTPVQVTLSAVALAGRGHWIEVYGENGTLILGNANQKDYIHGFTLSGSQAGEPLTQLEIPEYLAFPKLYDDGRLAPFIRVVDHWVTCIDNQKTSAPSLEEGIYSQLLMDLTHQAHSQQTWVEVPR
ncbi:MAG: Gfo/Idh/MocA family oxidoreductase [Leptolyngbya sp. SIO3F4]|nr:Gfo/Idh/MocA family oxidoreductase [Leptolyngbya sp. SIO3F4]